MLIRHCKLLAVLILLSIVAAQPSYASDGLFCPGALTKITQAIKNDSGLQLNVIKDFDDYLDRTNLGNGSRRAEWKSQRKPHNGKPEKIATVDPAFKEFVYETSYFNALLVKAVRDNKIPVEDLGRLAEKHRKLFEKLVDQASYHLRDQYPHLFSSTHIWKNAVRERTWNAFKSFLYSKDKVQGFIDYLNQFKGMRGELNGVIHLPNVEAFAANIGDIKSSFHVHQVMVSEAINQRFQNFNKADLDDFPILKERFESIRSDPAKLQSWIQSKEIDVIHQRSDGKIGYTEVKDGTGALDVNNVMDPRFDKGKSLLKQIVEVSEIIRFLKLEDKIQVEFLPWAGITSDAKQVIESQGIQVLDLNQTRLFH